MISVTSFDIAVLGELDKNGPSPQPDHFIILYVNEKEVFRSKRTLRVPAPQWKDKKSFRFDFTSRVKIVIFRRSLLAGQFSWKKYFVAKYTGRGIDLMNNADHALTNEAGDTITPRLSVKLNLVLEDHSEFMKMVDEDMKRRAKIDGADTTSTLTTTIGGNLGTVLQNIVPIFDSFAQTHSVINAAWVVLSSAYKIAKSQMDQDDEARELAERLCEMAGAASSWPNITTIEGTTDVIEEIGRIALDAAVLFHEYCDSSIRGKDSIAARIAKHSISNISSRVAECRKRCADLTVKLDRRVLNGISARLKGIQDAQTEVKIDKWIDAPDSSPNFNAARDKRQSGTGSWFINGSEFIRWMEQPDSVLWLNGDLGCGKTILCSTAIQHILDLCSSNPSIGYAYFFFDGRNAQTELLYHEKLIRSIIKQLADRCDGVPAALQEMFRACNGGHRQPSVTLLEETLLCLLKSFSASYIIIDALDECADRYKLLKWIQSIASATSGKIHLFVTSRREPDILRDLGSIPSLENITIATNLAADDIGRFLDARLSEDDKWGEVEKKIIRDALMGGADGKFTWVGLQFEELKKCLSRRELEEQLKSLPRDLNETYSRTLARSSRSGDLKRLLQWLAYSERPMTVLELAEVALIDFGRDDLDMPVYNSDQRYHDVNDVLAICSGFVSEFEGTVKLAHFSVKEYLISQHIAPSFRTSEWESHATIAQTCIAYLLHFDKLGSINYDNIKSFPLAEYAAKYWVSHFHSARSDTTNSPALQQLMLDLFRPAARCAVDNWVRIREPNSGLQMQLSAEANDFASPLYYACYCGLQEAVQDLIDDGADVNAETGYRTALAAASIQGHLEIAKVLVENGARVVDIDPEKRLLAQISRSDNVSINRRGTALHMALVKGSIEIVKLLLENGADINAAAWQLTVETHEATTTSTELKGDVLHMAVATGNIEIVKLLLEKGALINTQGRVTVVEEYEGATIISVWYGTVLTRALQGGQINMAKLLLENGADINAEAWSIVEESEWATSKRTERFGTVLQWACAQRKMDIVKMLAENGADMNAKAWKIVVGAHEPHTTRTKFPVYNFSDSLMDGVDIRAEAEGAVMKGDAFAYIPTEQYQSLLQKASESGDGNIANLLLENGTEVNAEGIEMKIYGYQPSKTPAKFGTHTASCNLVVAGNVDSQGIRMSVHSYDAFNMTTERYGTVLQVEMDSATGDIDMVKLLLEGADVNSHARAVDGWYNEKSNTWRDIQVATALEMACTYGNIKVAKLLVEHGAPVGCALWQACYYSHLETAKLLLDHGADVDDNGRGGLALQIASRRGRRNIVELLIQHGADVNAKGGYYGTAQQAAGSYWSSKSTVTLLKEHGAVDHEEAHELDRDGSGKGLEVVLASDARK